MSRPNFVLIMADQQRWDTLGCYGNSFVVTPNLDALAAGGMRFTRAFTPYPVCTPARTTMWTGVYPHVHGLVENVYQQDDALAETARVKRTVFHELAEAGYDCAYFGKWHLGDLNPGPFSVWEAFNSRGGHWADGRQASQGGTYRPDVQTEDCIRFLESRKAGDKPFMMVQGFYPPHNPFTAPEAFYAPYRGKGVPFAGYYAACSALDACVGRIVAALEATGQRENTVIVYFADHGETFNYREDSKHKFVCFEEAIRIPFVLDWPGRVTPGRAVDAPVGLEDLMPTVLDLAGLPRPALLQGASLAPWLQGTPSGWREDYYVQNRTHGNGYHQRALRTDKWKLILSEGGPSSLFDLATDPEEELDLFDVPHEDIHDQYRHYPSHRPVINELATRLAERARSIGDQHGIAIAEGALRPVPA